MASLEDIEKAVQAIKAGKAAPVYLLFGDQDYLVKQAFDRINEALVPENIRDFNFEQYDGASADIGEVTDALATVAMMPGPKVVAVPDCRFLLSKASGGDLLLKARQAWEKGEVNSSLRHLAKVLILSGSDWQKSADWTLSDFKAELGAEGIADHKLEGDWLAKALLQGLNSSFPLPASGDDSGRLLESLQEFYQPKTGEALTGHHLVMAAPSADGRKVLYKWIAKQGLVLDFKTAAKGPQGAQTARVFLKNHLRQKDLDMDLSTAERVISSYGHDLGLMVQEINKMESFAHPRRKLHGQDLDTVGSPRPEENIFKLLDALGEKRLDQALPLLRDQMNLETPMQLFGRLAAETRMLVISRGILDAGLAPAKGPANMPQYRSTLLPKLLQELPESLAELWKRKHAFVTFQSLRRAWRFHPEHLRAMIGHLHRAESQLTSSGVDSGLILEELCARFCGVEEEVFL